MVVPVMCRHPPGHVRKTRLLIQPAVITALLVFLLISTAAVSKGEFVIQRRHVSSTGQICRRSQSASIGDTFTRYHHTYSSKGALLSVLKPAMASTARGQVLFETCGHFRPSPDYTRSNDASSEEEAPSATRRPVRQLSLPAGTIHHLLQA